MGSKGLITLIKLYLLLSICILNPCLNCDLPQRLALVHRVLKYDRPNLTQYVGGSTVNTLYKDHWYTVPIVVCDTQFLWATPENIPFP
ncbi:hypothetical protein PF005_g30548 [Phytophthora fragariae]|uniref:Uncharacterized protein n=1 Tax=Phytophthora fragariae TaxID=53985 RepID=A0A6A4B5Z6_9STRA|nr:hypothetical protein PF003_g39552 [Phytophthora fragariae]KAE8921665.1 hypothetical protein PF009_g28060 [Phytophthora fragariae]KAE9071598.1 hypothetical protein PF006_g29112 [Phytophthora fragariae]KAE9072872.1 hypothetical protein PF007_g26018 [Phytophthora fragariae]KAE9163180.1 hypothetical protein PF005_g30548 [Phytophthora fragariae]